MKPTIDAILECQGFKAVPGFPNYYVNRVGVVISTRLNRRQKLKGYVHKGYLGFTLYRNKKPFCKKAHVLVAETFISPRPIGKECAHKNGNPADNRVENLYWATRLENENDKDRHGTRRTCERHPCAKLNQKQVEEIRKKYRRESYHKSNTNQLAKEYGVDRSMIMNIVSGRNWSDSTTKRLTRLASDGKND